MFHYKQQSNNLKITQNYLKEPLIAKKLIAISSVNKNDLVIEIGSGQGVLTEELLKRSNKVIAIEKDPDLYNYLKKYFDNEIRYKKLYLYNQDFLKFELPKENFIIFSNIPYNITSQIMAKILDNYFLNKAYLVIQKESAERFAGFPYSQETMISLLNKIDYRFQIIFNLSRENFVPKPSVDSVLLEIERVEYFRTTNRQDFRNFIVYIYAHSKTSLRKTLKTIFSNLQINILYQNLKIKEDHNLRDINFDQWLEIYKLFEKLNTSKREVIKNAENILKNQQKSLEKSFRTRKPKLSY